MNSNRKKNPIAEIVKSMTVNDSDDSGQENKQYLEKELQKSTERFKTIFNRCNDAIFIIDPHNLKIIDANDRAAAMLGYEHATLSTMRASDIYPRQGRKLKKFAKTIFEYGRGWTDSFSCRHRNGEAFPTEISAWPIEIGGQMCMLAFIQDINKKIRAEKALVESERRFSALIRNMQEGVMIVDNDDSIQFVNSRMCEMLGYDKKDLLGQVGYKILFRESEQEVIREKNQLRRRKVADKYEIEMQRKDGQYIWVQISGVPITDANGAVSGSFGIITDINERRLAVDALKEARDDLEKRVEERTRELVQSNKSLRREVYERVQLEEERQKFISLIENSKDVIMMASPEGNLLYINEFGKKTLGIEHQENPDAEAGNGQQSYSKHLIDCLPSEHQAFLTEELLPVLISEGAWQGELPLQNFESGRIIPTLYHGFTVHHPITNEVSAIAIICRDITDRKRQEEALSLAKDELESRVQERTAELSEANQVLMQQILERQRAEEQLQQSEEKYRLLFNSGNDSVFVYHPSEEGQTSNYFEVNDVACQKLGYTRDELLKISARTILLEFDEEKNAEKMRRLADNKHIIYEEIFLTKTGDAIPVEISAHLFEFNEKPAVMSIARDITSRKRAEEQIREQAALLDKAQDAILVCDLNDYIIYWNKSAERLYGWKTEESIGNNAFELLFKKDSTQYIASRRAVLENEEWQGELQQVTKEGKDIIVESRWTLVHDKGGEAKSILVVNTDVTEKKKIEAQFLRAQRMESIGALAGGIAHDLNNVLAPILTAIQILQVRFDDDKSQKILGTVESNVKRGADMVKQILTFARGVEGERVPLQLQHLIFELDKITLDTFPKSISTHLDIATDLWAVSGDATQLHQVLLNLCVNARDAMSEGGKLEIYAKNVTLDEAFVRTHLEARLGEYVLVKVSDTGVGIPANVINKIFEPFFTTKEPGKGTGLGLSTVIAIVNSHGGFLNVVSEPQKGTLFEVYLPAVVEPGDEINFNDEPPLPAGNGEVVLLVDDETSILEITKETLETYGYSVFTAHDGAEAVGQYAQNKDVIDVVITDMMMPVMDGAATIRALKKINPDIKIVASSGFVEDAKVAEIVGNGVKAFLHKPYTADKILFTLHRILKQ